MVTPCRQVVLTMRNLLSISVHEKARLDLLNGGVRDRMVEGTFVIVIKRLQHAIIHREILSVLLLLSSKALIQSSLTEHWSVGALFYCLN